MFVKYECGCKAIKLCNRVYVYAACDGDYDNPISIFSRKVDKPYVALTDQEVSNDLIQISELVADGYRYREVKRLLS